MTGANRTDTSRDWVPKRTDTSHDWVPKRTGTSRDWVPKRTDTSRDWIPNRTGLPVTTGTSHPVVTGTQSDWYSVNWNSCIGSFTSSRGVCKFSMGTQRIFKLQNLIVWIAENATYPTCNTSDDCRGCVRKVYCRLEVEPWLSVSICVFMKSREHLWKTDVTDVTFLSYSYGFLFF